MLSSLRTILTIVGGVAGFVLGFYVGDKYLGFEAPNTLYAGVAGLAAGLVVLHLIRGMLLKFAVLAILGVIAGVDREDVSGSASGIPSAFNAFLGGNSRD